MCSGGVGRCCGVFAVTGGGAGDRDQRARHGAGHDGGRGKGGRGPERWGRGADLLSERMQDAQAMQWVDQAIRLNPLNLPALRVKFQALRATGTPAERFAGMLAMLRANPAQPALVLAVAEELADAGLPPAAFQ